MYRRTEKRGERARLRITEYELEWIPCRLSKPTGDLDALVESLVWRCPRAARFQRVAHINIQEVLACGHEVLAASFSRRTKQTDFGCTFRIESRLAQLVKVALPSSVLTLPCPSSSASACYSVSPSVSSGYPLARTCRTLRRAICRFLSEGLVSSPSRLSSAATVLRACVRMRTGKNTPSAPQRVRLPC